MKELTFNPLLNSLDFVKANNYSTKSLTNGSNGELSPHILNISVTSILMGEVLKTTIEDHDAFFVANLASVVSQYKKWSKLLPRVTPYYAVKCNPDPLIIKTLAQCGAGFDCASKAEIQSVLNAGVDTSRVIYANPCKQSSHIKFASSHNVSIMTFDNADELYKISVVAPATKLVLRILTDDSKSICRFGVKFGASLSIVPHLLKVAKELQLDIIGISFHVGSGCYDASAFVDAVRLARNAFDIGTALGFNFNFLDIGGGFPGENPSGLQFEEIADLIRPLIDDLFPPTVRVIAEPGRFFASAAFTLAVNIVAKRVIARDNVGENSKSDLDNHPSFMYYINDGMYGSFNCITFDHVTPVPRPLYSDGKFLYEVLDRQSNFSCSIWGPTCDSIDLIGSNFSLPEMNIGDWIVFDRMGAYTMAAASNFNGFSKSRIIYTYSP